MTKENVIGITYVYAEIPLNVVFLYYTIQSQYIYLYF